MGVIVLGMTDSHWGRSGTGRSWGQWDGGQDERQMEEGKGATFEGERYQKKREELASLGRLGQPTYVGS